MAHRQHGVLSRWMLAGLVVLVSGCGGGGGDNGSSSTSPGAPSEILNVKAAVTSSASPHTGAPVSFGFTGQYAPGTTVSWNFGDGSAASGSSSPQHTYAAAGNYLVALTATSPTGKVAVNVLPLAVAANSAPSGLTIAVQPVAPLAGATVTLVAGATDADGDNLQFSWQIAGGPTQKGNTIQTSFPAAGTYTLALNVVDGAGGVTSLQRSLVVAPAGPVPPVVPPSAPLVWTETFKGVSTQRVRDVRFRSATEGHAVISNLPGSTDPVLVHTVDAGQSWQPLATGKHASLQSAVQFVSPLEGWVAGSGESRVVSVTPTYTAIQIDWGALLHTIDGGATWTSVSPVTNELNGAYTDLRFVDGRTGWIIGVQPSAVLATTDAGATWTRQLALPSPTSYVRFLRVLDAKHLWAVDVNQLFRSTDGGVTWNQYGISDPASGVTGITVLHDLQFVDALHGYASADVASTGTLLFKTADGGQTWAVMNSPVLSGTSNAAIYSISFADTLNGFALSYSGGLYKTADGGASWTWLVADDFSARRESAILGQIAPKTWVSSGAAGSNLDEPGIFKVTIP